jgi:putative NIF3 family GTP cyclohydrolase 1 type 2
VRFDRAQRLGTLVERITNGLGPLSGVCVAVPQSVPAGLKAELEITTVGICAGSGGSMLAGLDVDLLFTGELSHHEALAAIETGKVVVTAFHSNTERKFLRDRMQRALKIYISEALQAQAAEAMTDDVVPAEVDQVQEFDVAVSDVDRDPYEIVMAGSSKW